MKAFLRALRQSLRRARLAGPSVSIAPDSQLASSLLLRPGWQDGQPGFIHVAARAKLEQGVVLDAFGGRITIGRDSFLGPYTVVYGHGGVEIGDECLIAMHCRILSSKHTLAPAGTAIRTQPDIRKPTRLGRDVWLGAGVTVFGGVTIGDGCVVGAGAVVTADLPAHSIAVGVPARIVGRRPAAT